MSVNKIDSSNANMLPEPMIEKANPLMVRAGEASWPTRLSNEDYRSIELIGDPAILSIDSIALFCSSRCSGEAILRSLKWVGDLAEGSRAVISGFHSALEKSYLELLLLGSCPVIVCPPRSLLRYRIPKACQVAISERRLTIVSSQPESVRSNSAASSLARNRLVAALAAEIVVIHAAEGSRTEQFALELVQRGRTVKCLDPNCNTLLSAGVRLMSMES